MICRHVTSFPCNFFPWGETTLWSKGLWHKAKSSCKELTAWIQDAFTTTPHEIWSSPSSSKSPLDASVSISPKSSWNFTNQEQKNPLLLFFLKKYFLAFCSPVTDTHLNSCEASWSSRLSQCLLLVQSCLFLPSPPTSWSNLLHPLNFLSKFVEGSGKANALTQGTSPCIASANKLPGETWNWSLVSALQKINTLAKQVKQYPRTNLHLQKGELRAGPRGV